MRNELGPDGPIILAVGLDGSLEELEQTARAYGYHGPVARIASEEGVLDPLGVRGIPGLAFVNARGVIVSAATGNRSRRFIAERARALSR